MPPPAPNPPPLPQRRATRPRAIRRRVFVRNTAAALEVGLDAIIATGQATLATRTTKAHGAGPSSGAGDEAFTASPLSLSPAPSRQATPTPKTTADVPPNTGTRTAAAASTVMQTRPAAPVPSPRSPRFTAVQA
ncbi:jg27359, partial [Pararge aegeria aegeria]